MNPVEKLKARILSKIVRVSSGCWEWTGHVGKNGYGQIWYNGTNTSAHRISHVAFKGAVDKKLHVDHLCKNRKCVNPSHLEAVTPKENIARSDSLSKQEARRTHCPQGHEYNEENTYRHQIPNGSITRSCYICMLARTRIRNHQRSLAGSIS